MGEPFSCRVFLTTRGSAQWRKGREPESGKGKQKGKLVWKSQLVSPFHVGGSMGLSDVHRCLCGMLSDDSMAPAAVRNVNTVMPGIADKASSRTKF